jgi:DNA modification methylase
VSPILPAVSLLSLCHLGRVSWLSRILNQASASELSIMTLHVIGKGGRIVSLFGRDVLALGKRTQERYLQTAIDYWRAEGFPYECLPTDEIEVHFRHVSHSPLLDLAVNRTIGASSVGLRLANSYQPQIWHARSHGHRRSPVDHFQDDVHLRTMLERAPRFWPNARCWSAQAIRNLARIYCGGRVANYRPFVARNIINHFSRRGDVVLDFSAGYGGRLLGCLTLEERTYIGIDPARKQVIGLRRMNDDLKTRSAVKVDIVEGCAEDVLSGMRSNFVDLIFSSPPFFNLEIYSDEPTQSSNRYPTYQEWRTCFLDVVIAQSRRVLRRGGIMAINVSSRRRYPVERDTLDLAARLFSHTCTISVAMPARPLQRSLNSAATRTEPIYVFRKR